MRQQKFVYFLLVLLFGLVLAACGGAQETVQEVVEETVQEIEDSGGLDAEVAPSTGSEDEAVVQPIPPRDKSDATSTEVAQANAQPDANVEGVRAQTEPTPIPIQQPEDSEPGLTLTWGSLLLGFVLLAGGLYIRRGPFGR